MINEHSLTSRKSNSPLQLCHYFSLIYADRFALHILITKVYHLYLEREMSSVSCLNCWAGCSWSVISSESLWRKASASIFLLYKEQERSQNTIPIMSYANEAKEGRVNATYISTTSNPTMLLNITISAQEKEGFQYAYT